MKPEVIEDRQKIYCYFSKNTGLFIYSIGDLDDFFWNDCCFYCIKEDNEIKSIALLYTGLSLPCFLAFYNDSTEKEYVEKLVLKLSGNLPGQFSTHLSPGISTYLTGFNQIIRQGRFYKMQLRSDNNVNKFSVEKVVKLGPEDINDIKQLYVESYPENWFDRKMLETGQYYGVRQQNKLVSIAGVHVYSPDYGVAALGNITTHPLWRGQGWGTAVTARLCRSLLQSVKVIGLNVKSDNLAAVSCYEKLGFEIIAEFDEFVVKR
ncbi:MAG: GNAT family N-acetyltransferase [bacterium]